ncbi:MAG: C1 family peptidase [Planctomycetota bacterium]
MRNIKHLLVLGGSFAIALALVNESKAQKLEMSDKPAFQPSELQKFTGARLSTSIRNGTSLPSQLIPRNQVPNNYRIPKSKLTLLVRNQGDCGACTSFAACGALQVAIMKAKPQSVVMPGDYYKNVIRGDCETGYNTWKMVQNLENKGVPTVPLSRSPAVLASGAGVTAKASRVGYVTDKEEMRRILASGYPLVADYSITPLWSTYKAGIWSESTAQQEYKALVRLFPRLTPIFQSGIAGGHAVLIVGYFKPGVYRVSEFSGAVKQAAKTLPQLDITFRLDHGVWVCQNSWGKDWGDNGYFYIVESEPTGQGRDPIDDYAYWVEGAEFYRGNQRIE